MQTKHLAQLQFVTNAVISPNGKFVAYTLSVPHELLEKEDGAAWEELHVVDRAANSRAFITGKERISGINWSADSGHITYVAKRDGDEHKALYRIPVDGGESRQVHAHPGNISGSRTSPDNTKILFIAQPEKTRKKKRREKQGFDHSVYEEDWVLQQLWLLPAGQEEEEAKALDVPGSVHRVRWHPDGRRIAVTAAPSPSIDDGFIDQRLLIFDTHTNQVTREIPRKGKLRSFEFSPDGRHLALIAGSNINDPRAGRLMVSTLR